MKIPNYNTTVVSKTSIAINEVMITKSSEDYLVNATTYTSESNKLYPVEELHCQIFNNVWQLQAKYEIKNWLRHKPTNQPLNNFELSYLHSFLSMFFSDPTAFASRPLIDMLYLTIDACEDVLKSIKVKFLKQPPEFFSLKKTGSTHILKNFNDVYQNFAFLSNSHGDMIALYWGMHPKVREKRLKHRLLKITINPARHSGAELQSFFRWLKEVLGKNAKVLVNNANVTRLDIALDLVGVHLPDLLIDRSSQQYDYHLNESSSGSTVGTQQFGSPMSTHSRAYNKLQKLLDLGPVYIPVLVYDDEPLSHIPIIRLEAELHPQDNEPFTLRSIFNAPYFLKGTKVYSPRLLALLSPEQRKDVQRYGFGYWFNKLDGRKSIDEKTLSSAELKINHQLLESLQLKALFNLRKLIRNA